MKAGDSLAGLPVVDAPDYELKLCIAAFPAALLLGLLFHALMPSIQRMFFGMPVHELGHAVTAWFVGHWAIPTLWKTITAETRGVVMPVLLLAAIGTMMYRAHATERRALVFAGAGLLVLQFIGTLVIKPVNAEALIVFGGDGVGMILATVLMCTFFFGKRTQLYRGSLRWGFLVIGAAAFSDMFGTWFDVWRDAAEPPYGEIEGVGLSDSARLVGDFMWTEKSLARRMAGVGFTCLAALALVYSWGVRRAMRHATSARGRGTAG